jgi:hypothetical protein
LNPPLHHHHLLPIHPFTLLPHKLINPRVFSQQPKPAMPRLIYPRVGFALFLSSHFPVFYLLSSNQQCLFDLSPISHHVLRFCAFGVWFFGLGSSHLRHLFQDMLLGNGFTGVSGVRRWSSPPPLSPGGRRVLLTRPNAPLNIRRVELSPTSSSAFRFSPRQLQKISAPPVVERPPLGGAWFSRTSRNDSHLSSEAVVCVFLFMYFWALLFCSFPLVYPCFCVWVLVTQYTCQIIFIGDPGFVASLPRANGPTSLEALSPRTFILSFIFGLPRPCSVFLFPVVIGSHVSKKKI